MTQRTLSCICLGPTGNVQGGHWFMSLTSGDKLIRYRWTELPMPREAITRVNAIGRRQNMPCTITYANRYGTELPETVDDYPTDDEASDSDDDTYSQPASSDDDSILSADSNSSTSTTTSGGSSNSASDDDSHDDDIFPPHADPVHAPLPPPLLVHAPPPPPLFADNALGNQGVPAANQGVGNNEFAADADDASVDIPGNEDENGENGNENEIDETSGDNESQTESEEFRII